MKAFVFLGFFIMLIMTLNISQATDCAYCPWPCGCVFGICLCYGLPKQVGQGIETRSDSTRAKRAFVGFPLCCYTGQCYCGERGAPRIPNGRFTAGEAAPIDTSVNKQ